MICEELEEEELEAIKKAMHEVIKRKKRRKRGTDMKRRHENVTGNKAGAREENKRGNGRTKDTNGEMAETRGERTETKRTMNKSERAEKRDGMRKRENERINTSDRKLPKGLHNSPGFHAAKSLQELSALRSFQKPQREQRQRRGSGLSSGGSQTRPQTRPPREQQGARRAESSGVTDTPPERAARRQEGGDAFKEEAEGQEAEGEEGDGAGGNGFVPEDEADYKHHVTKGGSPDVGVGGATARPPFTNPRSGLISQDKNLLSLVHSFGRNDENAELFLALRTEYENNKLFLRIKGEKAFPEKYKGEGKGGLASGPHDGDPFALLPGPDGQYEAVRITNSESEKNHLKTGGAEAGRRSPYYSSITRGAPENYPPAQTRNNYPHMKKYVPVVPNEHTRVDFKSHRTSASGDNERGLMTQNKEQSPFLDNALSPSLPVEPERVKHKREDQERGKEREKKDETLPPGVNSGRRRAGVVSAPPRQKGAGDGHSARASSASNDDHAQLSRDNDPGIMSGKRAFHDAEFKGLRGDLGEQGEIRRIAPRITGRRSSAGATRAAEIRRSYGSQDEIPGRFHLPGGNYSEGYEDNGPEPKPDQPIQDNPSGLQDNQPDPKKTRNNRSLNEDNQGKASRSQRENGKPRGTGKSGREISKSDRGTGKSSREAVLIGKDFVGLQRGSPILQRQKQNPARSQPNYDLENRPSNLESANLFTQSGISNPPDILTNRHQIHALMTPERSPALPPKAPLPTPFRNPDPPARRTRLQKKAVVRPVKSSEERGSLSDVQSGVPSAGLTFFDLVWSSDPPLPLPDSLRDQPSSVTLFSDPFHHNLTLSVEPPAPLISSRDLSSTSSATLTSKAPSRVVPILGLFDLTARPDQHLGGRSELAAAQLALKHINDKGVIPGHELVLFTNDTHCDSGKGVDAFFHAIYTSKARIMFLLGAACPEVTESLASVVPYWNIVQ
ncbi:putative gamma-aminobutyric acid type B receptor subunit 2-like, partial [Penaeus vannamei]